MAPVPPPSINPNDYDPISNLEKQYAEPIGSRVTVILKLNNQCIVPGGVDTVLRNERSNRPNIVNGFALDNGSSGNLTTVENSIQLDMNNLHVSQDQNVNVSKQSTPSSASAGSNNPFDFLYDDTASTGNTVAGKGEGKQSKVASIFAKAKNQFERGVTTIAVQAQKATTSGSSAEIRDIITIGAYIQDESTGKFNVCLGMTERSEMPNSDGNGITFQIPITIPPHLLESKATNSGTVIQFYIWMRSGAAIFAKNRALRRYYSVGNAMLRIANLAQAMQPKFDGPIVMTLPVQSSVINEGFMTMIFTRDTKFPALCGNGWSLSDPRTDTAYTFVQGKRRLHNPPLDQSYVFQVNNSLDVKTDSILLTTERTTESAVVLPLAFAYKELVVRAADISTAHALELTSKLQCSDGASSINDPMKAMQLGHAQVQIEVMNFLRYNKNNSFIDSAGSSVNVMLNFQRPDSIFENCIATGSVPSQPYIQNAQYPQNPAISVPFYPRVVLASDPRLLPGESATNKEFFVGKIRFELCEHSMGGAGADVFSPIGPTGAVGTCPKKMEALVDIDSYINKGHETLVQAPVVDLKSGGAVGLLILKVAANTLEGMVDRAAKSISTSATGKKSVESPLVEGGLISFVGLETLLEDDKACYPHSDLVAEAAKRVFSKSSASSNADRRKRQISTMGEFLTYIYLNNHVKMNRLPESKYMNEKMEAYKTSLFTPPSENEEEVSPDKRKDPRPFRPSSSRMEPILSSIGFNVHVQNFSVSTISIDKATGNAAMSQTSLFKNVTCGAPADHFRGFSKKGQSGSSFSGGLRRLEAMRLNAAQYVRETQDNLIGAIGDFYSAQSTSLNVHLPGRSARHIAPSNHDIGSLRTACIAAVQSLHNLTWEIAVRRANVFSQALGIAVTLYLAHVSDLAKLQRGAWADLWKRHGFLIAFEGLLSAAGKELGMIEDAAVGINMLRMASVVFVTETNVVQGEYTSGSCIPVPDSPYIKWLRINHSDCGTKTKYLVEICVDVNFYAQRIPTVLKGNTAIRFYPMLYEMGVDIRQWGANAGNFSKGSSAQDEMDDDEVGIPDNDVLIALNYEAFRKMNAYAHSVYRCDERPILSWEDAHNEQLIQQSVHPMLKELHEFIKSSAGKMEHGVIDQAAHAAAKLGGGSAIFCKSGKDRTAMQVTFKQSQFINRFLITGGNGHADECVLDEKVVFKDATLMRVYGTRLPICDKNVGQSLYAFNSLQARFMPDVLKPPPRTLAGFLKGGRVFSREGGIES